MIFIICLPFVVFFSFFSFGSSCDNPAKFLYAEDLWESTHGKIIFSATVFRHGDRFAFEDFPTNPHSDKLRKAGLEKLTKDGKYRSYMLGRWVRARYNPLINAEPYTSKLVHMISSFSERAVMSGQLFYAGFYPPVDEEKEKWNPDIAWQPIPVYTSPPSDRMFTMREYCAAYIHEMERIKSSPEILEFYEKHKHIIDHIKENSKFPIPDDADYVIRSIQRTSVMYDILFSQQRLGLDIPKWAEEVYPSGRHDITIMFYKLHTYTDIMKRLKGGPLLAHIIKELEEKRKKPKSRKLFQFYSGHDANLIALMDMLGMWKEILTPFSSALLFELRQLGEDDYAITISYRGEEGEPLELLEIPDCPGPCKFETFLAIAKKRVPEDWEKECRTLRPDYNKILF